MGIDAEMNFTSGSSQTDTMRMNHSCGTLTRVFIAVKPHHGIVSRLALFQVFNLDQLLVLLRLEDALETEVRQTLSEGILCTPQPGEVCFHCGGVGKH